MIEIWHHVLGLVDDCYQPGHSFRFAAITRSAIAENFTRTLLVLFVAAEEIGIPLIESDNPDYPEYCLRAVEQGMIGLASTTQQDIKWVNGVSRR